VVHSSDVAISDVEIRRWDQLALELDHDRLLTEMDHVFFSSSSRQSFASDEEKAAFRERWLGRYLLHFPQYVLVALNREQHVVGYIIGSPDDPARDPLFADLSFFAHFRDLTARYPAQLHVNLDEAWRGRGIGARLLAAFSELARASGAPGVHVITARGMRNVSYYSANGFIERGSIEIGGRELLFLGRDL
jgi:GNAT superfamily N-acetyltransferase